LKTCFNPHHKTLLNAFSVPIREIALLSRGGVRRLTDPGLLIVYPLRGMAQKTDWEQIDCHFPLDEKKGTCKGFHAIALGLF